MRYTFKKGERLKSRKLIEQLFLKGKRLKSFPLQMVYLQIDHKAESLYQAGFTVSKKHFKRAVDRNRIKRIIRETYRLQKHIIDDEKYTKKYIFMIIYTSNQKFSYQEVAEKTGKLLEKFSQITYH